MAVAQTTLLAYNELKMSGKLGNLQSKIYALIQERNDLSNRDIARILGLEICTVTGRVNELAGKGMVTAWGRKTDPRTGKTVKIWKAVA